MVSAVPSSPDCTTKASRPVVRNRRNKGSRSLKLRREIIALDGNTGGSGLRLPAPSFRPPAVGFPGFSLNSTTSPQNSSLFNLRQLSAGNQRYPEQLFLAYQ